MINVILTRGLPASGKSSWASTMVANNTGVYKRVEKDILRDMLDLSVWSKKNESFIEIVRNEIICRAIGEQYSVIVSDTNLHPRNYLDIEFMIQRINKSGNNPVGLYIKDFMHVSLYTCLERNNERRGREFVPEDVIKRMYDDYYQKHIKQWERLDVKYWGDNV
jgi:tRNA uridine 5-carbamoylmethylation protein Kti12